MKNKLTDLNNGKVGRFKRCLAYNDAAPEVRPALLTIAKLSHKARTRRAAR